MGAHTRLAAGLVTMNPVRIHNCQIQQYFG